MKIYTTECRMTHLKRLYAESEGIELDSGYLDSDDAPAIAAMLRECADELDPAAASQGADARPVAIYQVRAGAYRWDDVLKDAWDATVDNSKRIVYATRDAAPSDAPIVASVRVNLTCRGGASEVSEPIFEMTSDFEALVDANPGKEFLLYLRKDAT